MLYITVPYNYTSLLNLRGWYSVGASKCLLRWFDMTYVGEIIYSEIHMAVLDAVKETLSVPLYGFKVHASFQEH